MQELTLTGATLLGSSNSNQHNQSCNNPNHNHNHSSHHHHHPTTNDMTMPSTDDDLQPLLATTNSTPTTATNTNNTMMISAVDFVEQQYQLGTTNGTANHVNTLLFQSLSGLIQMGTYELFHDVLQAWRVQANALSGDSAGDSEIHAILQQYDPAGHTLAHWAAKRVDDARFLQHILSIPYPAANSYPDDATSACRTVLHRPSRDSTGMTPIHWVCTMPDSLLLLNRMLQFAGTDLLEWKDLSGCTPLLVAAQHGHVETVAFLLQKGANLAAVDTSYDTAMHWASYKGSQPVLGLLCYYVFTNTTNSKTLLTSADIYGQTPLHLASLRGHTSCCRYLIQQLILLDDSESTSSKTTNKYRTLKEILYLKDKNGRTPYELAIHKEKPNVANVLQQTQEMIHRYYYFHQNGGHPKLWLRGGWKQPMQVVWYTLSTLLKSMTQRQTWKVWMGMGAAGMDEYDEAPRVPLYYVCGNFIVHVIYNFTVFLPISNTSAGVLWDYIGLILLNLSMIGMTALLLYQAITTDPGILNTNHANSTNHTTNNNNLKHNNDNNMNDIISLWKRRYEETLEEMASIDDTTTTTQPTKMKYTLCHTCHIARPLRSKHCKISRSCILVYDHYCPFVGTAVGMYNYKYFFAFLGGMTLYFINFWILFITYYLRKNRTTSIGDTQQLLPFILGIVLGFHIVFPILMLLYHTQLIYANLTTNEHMNQMKYDYLWKTKTSSCDDTHCQQQHRSFSNPFNKNYNFFYNFVDRMFPTSESYTIPDMYDNDNNFRLKQSPTKNVSIMNHNNYPSIPTPGKTNTSSSSVSPLFSNATSNNYRLNTSKFENVV